MAELPDRKSGGSLGEPLAVGVNTQRRVRPGGRYPAERAIEQELTGRREQQIGTADDFSDAHDMIVGDDREFVGREAVLTPDQEIAEVTSGDERLRSLKRVDEGDGRAIWHAEAPVRRARFAGLASGAERRAEGRRKDRLGVVLGMRGGQAAFDVLAGFIARVEDAGGLEQLPDLAEPRQTLRLDVGGVRAADIGSFRPLQAEPPKVFNRGVGELWTTASRIEVFGAIDERTPGGALGGESEGAGVTEV